jgi:hypothetical protein
MFAVTCAGLAMQLCNEDRYLYISSFSHITVFENRNDAHNAIKRTIRDRLKRGYDDHFAKKRCYKVLPLRGVGNVTI